MRSAPSKSPIPGNLRRLRLAAGLKQEKLAELADVTDATISRIERGRFAPSQALLQRLATALGVTEANLVARGGVPKKNPLRAAEARLLATVRGWDDASIDDLVRGIRLIGGAVTRSQSGRRS